MLLIIYYAITFDNSFLTTALGILSLATIAGLGLQRANTQSLREQLKDTRDEVTALRGQRQEDRGKISELTADLESLKRVVTGEVHWQSLSDLLEQHHTEAITHWRDHEEVVDKMVIKIDQIEKDVGLILRLVKT